MLLGSPARDGEGKRLPAKCKRTVEGWNGDDAKRLLPDSGTSLGRHSIRRKMPGRCIQTGKKTAVDRDWLLCCDGLIRLSKTGVAEYCECAQQKRAKTHFIFHRGSSFAETRSEEHT